MKRIVIFAVLLIAAAGIQAQSYHWDFRPPYINDSAWWSIIGDHDLDDGHCDNTDGDQQGFPDVDCGAWNDAPQAPIMDVSQDCGSGYCTVSATVRCPNMPISNGVKTAYFTFTCTGSATGAGGGVRSGNLGNGKKGVRCGAIECGCQLLCPPGGVTYNGVHYQCTSEFFGSPAMVGGNPANYECQ